MNKKETKHFSCHQFLDDIRLPNKQLVKQVPALKNKSVEFKVRSVISTFADAITDANATINHQRRVNRETQDKYSACRNDRTIALQKLKDTEDQLRISKNKQRKLLDDLANNDAMLLDVNTQLNTLHNTNDKNKVIMYIAIIANVLLFAYIIWFYAQSVI